MTKKKFYPVLKALTALLLVVAMVITLLPTSEAQAATVKISSKKATLYVGQTKTLTLKNYKKTVLWTSSDKAVASVDADGVVKGLKKGKATITATTAKGKTFTCAITVKNPYVNPKKATLKEGEKLQLTVVGANPVSWSSSSKSNAKVSKTGLVTAVKAGDTVVTITAKCDNGKKYKCKITVTAAAGTGDTPGGGDNPGTGGNTYGIRNPKQKTKYQAEYTFTEPLKTNEQLAGYAREALRAGAKRFTVKIGSKDESVIASWCDNFYKLFSQYCAFSGYGNQYMYGYTYSPLITETNADLYFEMIYKDGWKAVVLLQHTDYEADDTVKKLLKIAQGIVDDAVESSSDLKKQLLYINDRICAMAEYDNIAALMGTDSVIEKIDGVYKVTPAHDATGVLINGKGVCESYASAYQLCLEILGVENYIMTSSDGAHVWNRVKVDGKWYHVDVTWNDTTDNMFFLLDDDKFLSETKRSGNPVENHTWFTGYMPE